MLKRLKRAVQNIRNKPIGRRFLYGYFLLNHHNNPCFLYKIMLVILSVSSIVIGVVLLFIPGPGILFILLGFVFMGMLSKNIAKFLDKCEVKIRTK
jgi:hypothetical protein